MGHRVDCIACNYLSVRALSKVPAYQMTVTGTSIVKMVNGSMEQI